MERSLKRDKTRDSSEEKVCSGSSRRGLLDESEGRTNLEGLPSRENRRKNEMKQTKRQVRDKNSLGACNKRVEHTLTRRGASRSLGETSRKRHRVENATLFVTRTLRLASVLLDRLAGSVLFPLLQSDSSRSQIEALDPCNGERQRGKMSSTTQ